MTHKSCVKNGSVSNSPAHPRRRVLETKLATAFLLILGIALPVLAMEMALRIWLGGGPPVKWDPVLIPSAVPGLGYRLAVNFHQGNIRTNSEGLLWRGSSTGSSARRVLVMGDSIAFGGDVPPEQTFPALLERKLREGLGGGIEVWNAGTPGYNTTQESILLQEIGAKLHPDLVIVQFCMNDYQPTLVLNSRNVLESANEANPSLLGLLYRSKVIFFMKAKLQDLQKTYPEWFPVWAHYIHYIAQKPGWTQAKQSLITMRDWARKWDAALLLVIVPVEQQLRIQDNAPQTDLVDFAKTEAIPVLDLFDSFKQHWRDGLFVDYSVMFHAVDKVHLNQKGHALAAQEIASVIMDDSEYYLNFKR